MRVCGPWDPVVRELADHDPDRFAAIAKWPVEEAFAAYEAKLRRDANHDYELSTVVYLLQLQVGDPKKLKPPKIPAILKD